jgi:phosphatidylinositol glycan class B
VTVQARYAAPQALPAGTSRIGLLALAGILAVAMALRLVPVEISAGVNWPDEVFRATGAAPALIYGAGFVPSLAVTGALAALAALPVACCFAWCWRLFGLTGAVAGAAIVALSPELVYFGARALDEVVAGHLLVAALYVLEPEDDDALSRRRLVLGGVLIGLVAVLRVQMVLPLTLVILSAGLRAPETRLPPIAAGAAIVLAAFAILDAVVFGRPLGPIALEGLGAASGAEPGSYYGLVALAVWGGAAGGLALLALLGAGRKPVLLMTALAVIAVHAALPHKEYRFIYPAILLIAVLAGIGCAQLVAWGCRFLREQGLRAEIAASLPLLAIFYWLALAVHVWAGAGLPMRLPLPELPSAQPPSPMIVLAPTSTR